MYVDSARRIALAKIHYDLHDPEAPKGIKKKANMVKEKILREASDTKLARLREQLTKAVRMNDKLNTWKLTCQIKSHMHEEIPDDIYG